MKKSKYSELLHKFYFESEIHIPCIDNYGIYRVGLTSEEVTDYLHIRALQRKGGSKLLTAKQLSKLYKDYADIAGCNTCAVVDGKILHYRHDVLRHSEQLFRKKLTYWD